MPKRHFKNVLVAIAILIAFGAGRLYVEEPMAREMKARQYWPDTIKMEMRDQIGQLGFTAALGGFRSLVASILSVKAFIHWDNGRFDQANALHWIIVNLQPRSFFNWFQALHNTAYDKASAIQNAESRRADWEVQYREAFDEGRRFLEEARKFLPEDYRVYSMMAELYQERFRPWPPDFCKAAEYYKLAAECPNTKPYYKRFYAYAVAQCPGREQEGYRLMREVYDKGQRFPSVITHLKRLEGFLGIEPSKRIPEGTRAPDDLILRPGN